jgi:hypothetical protein
MTDARSPLIKSLLRMRKELQLVLAMFLNAPRRTFVPWNIAVLFFVAR